MTGFRAIVAILWWWGVALVGEESSVSVPLVYVSGYSTSVACYHFDPRTGAMARVSVSQVGTNPSFLAIGRGFAYAVDETADGMVGAYAINAGNGALTLVNRVASGGAGPCHVAIHPGGGWIFAANYGSGHVIALRVRADGGLEPGRPVLAGVHAHMALLDPSGRFVLVPCLGSDHIAIYGFNADTGLLAPCTPATVATRLGAGPRHLAFAPDGVHVYVINELDNTLTSWRWDPESGALTPLASAPTLPEATTVISHTAHLVVAPDGRTVYGSNRGHDSIASFSIADGMAAPLGHETGGDEIRVPRHFALSPDGRFALVASQGADLITVFRIDAESRAWTRLGATTVAAKPSCVVFADWP